MDLQSRPEYGTIRSSNRQKSGDDQMDSLEPKKLALLRVLQILWEESDIDHPLHQGRIVELLESKYGIVVERKAIGRNLSLLRDAGLEVENNGNGFYLNSRLFEDSELQLMIDSVLASQHISAPHSKELIEKICMLSNRYFPRHVGNIHSVEEWNKTDNKTLFYHIELVDEAIETGKMVEYEYNNKIDYYDLLDDSGNPLSLDVLKDSVKKVWEELGY